jgi:hypothetical protein
VVDFILHYLYTLKTDPPVPIGWGLGGSQNSFVRDGEVKIPYNSAGN